MDIPSLYLTKTIECLKSGGVAIIRTDTLYGIVARANDEDAVERVYRLKQRTPTKSPIVLLASTDQLIEDCPREMKALLKKYWPGKNSIILPSTKAPQWLTRGNNSVAYRVPDNSALRQLLQQTGPLIAPSANPEGLPPAMTILEAKSYFDSAVDCYDDGGKVTDDTPSKLFRLNDWSMERLR